MVGREAMTGKRSPSMEGSVCTDGIKDKCGQVVGTGLATCPMPKSCPFKKPYRTRQKGATSDRWTVISI
jgi:hypothetical protein